VPRRRDDIRRALAQVWDAQGRRFATFEALAARGEPDPDRWVQYLDGELNVRWPIDEEPAVALPRRGVALPAGAFPSWHVVGRNAVFAVGDARLEDVALLVDRLFETIVAPDAAGVAVRVEDHR
jgi:hypothetical protein